MTKRKTNTQEDGTLLTPREQVSGLLEIITQGLYEKEQILALALLCLVSGESYFLLGPPGTAKSEVSRRLKMLLRNATAFEYLMSRFSTPDEIFGPISVQKLKNEDIYERKTDGYLPSADIVFLDEIWKAGPSIQNALLTVINERIYQNGNATLRVPMKCLIAASNELPAEDEGLEALWDRFLVRVVSNCIQNEKTFYKMLQMQEMPTITIPKELLLSEEQLQAWRLPINAVMVPQHILEIITVVRQRLKQAGEAENAKAEDWYISDRRWRKVINLLRTSAFLNGRCAIDYSDMLLLIHVLWNRDECIEPVLRIVSESMFADIQTDMLQCEKDYQSNYNQYVQQVHTTQATQVDESRFAIFNYLYIALMDYPAGKCYFPKISYGMLNSSADISGVVYYDKTLNVMMIRNYDKHLGAFELSNQQQVQVVRLRRGPGCLVVDDIPYPIIQKGGEALTPQPTIQEEKSTDSLLIRINTIEVAIKQRIEDIKSSDNLFVVREDLQLLQTASKQLLKNIATTRAKITNLTKL